MPLPRTDPRHDSRFQRLSEFVAWTRKHIKGDEKSEAQIFLDRLFQAFGRPGILEVGGQCEFRIRKAREDGSGTAFADCVWKPIVLIEMKKRGEDLTRHYRQAFEYWTRLVPGRPRWVVLCNRRCVNPFSHPPPQQSLPAVAVAFDNLLDDPVDSLTLDELSEHWGALAFLFRTNETPKFRIDRIKVTREAADKLAECYRRVEARRNVGRRPRAPKRAKAGSPGRKPWEVGPVSLEPRSGRKKRSKGGKARDPAIFSRIIPEMSAQGRVYQRIRECHP